MTKECIEIIRQTLIPFVKKELLDINYEGLGKSDAEEFEKDLNEVLDMAIEALKSKTSDDKVSREVVEQIMWERDCAEAQLRELGYSLGEKIRTSEDCVSRQAVKKGMIKYGFRAPDMTVTEFTEDELPSVTPTHGTCKDCKKYRNSLEHCTQWVMPTNDDFYCADYEKAR